MAEFKRGLDDTFIDLLNNNYDQPDSWWRTLVEDPDVFIGIRGNELNAYYNGCSLLRLRHRRDHLVGETHRRRPTVSSPPIPAGTVRR